MVYSGSSYLGLSNSGKTLQDPGTCKVFLTANKLKIATLA
jgi:hypothetical protein